MQTLYFCLQPIKHMVGINRSDMTVLNFIDENGETPSSVIRNRCEVVNSSGSCSYRLNKLEREDLIETERRIDGHQMIRVSEITPLGKTLLEDYEDDRRNDTQVTKSIDELTKENTELRDRIEGLEDDIEVLGTLLFQTGEKAGVDVKRIYRKMRRC